MKKVFSVVLVGLVSILLISSCNTKTTVVVDSEDALSQGKRVSTDSLAGINIAFYYLDSVATQFRFYSEVDSMLKVKEMEFHTELEKKYRAYQAYENDIQRRLNNDEITGFQLEEIQKTAIQKQQAIQQFEQQRGEALQRESIQYQMALMNKIDQAGREFSEERGIDMLMFYQKGGQITYINNSFDVTASFINYLNKREDELKLGFVDELEALMGELDSLEGE